MAFNATAKELRRRTRRNWILAPILRLSNELLDEVCSHLDKPDLASLSTVCRALQPIAQSGVFRHLTITDRPGQRAALVALQQARFPTTSILLRIARWRTTSADGLAIRNLLRRHAHTVTHVVLVMGIEVWRLRELFDTYRMLFHISLRNRSSRSINLVDLVHILRQQTRPPRFVLEHIAPLSILWHELRVGVVDQRGGFWPDIFMQVAPSIRSFSCRYLVESSDSGIPSRYSIFQHFAVDYTFSNFISLPFLQGLTTLEIDQSHLPDVDGIFDSQPSALQLTQLLHLRLLAPYATLNTENDVYELAQYDHDPGVLTLQLLKRCPNIQTAQFNALSHQLQTGESFPFSDLPDSLTSVSIAFYANWFAPTEQHPWTDFAYNDSKAFFDSVEAWLSALVAPNLCSIELVLDWDHIYQTWAFERLFWYEDDPEEILSGHDTDHLIERLKAIDQAIFRRYHWDPDSEDFDDFLTTAYQGSVGHALSKEILPVVIDRDDAFRKEMQTRVLTARTLMDAKGIAYRFEVPLFSRGDGHAVAKDQMRMLVLVRSSTPVGSALTSDRNTISLQMPGTELATREASPRLRRYIPN